jgi:SAM-dependent methyltransferase
MFIWSLETQIASRAGRMRATSVVYRRGEYERRIGRYWCVTASETDGPDGIRNEYARHPGGVDGFYRDHGDTYANPHELAVQLLTKRLVVERDLIRSEGLILDLCCGSGEVTSELLRQGVGAERMLASDPYTSVAFDNRIGLPCEPWSFADIANGALATFEAAPLSVVVCSYALHLCESSWLPRLASALARSAKNLVVITPHKRPNLNTTWGWELLEDYLDPGLRVRMRTYESTLTISS